MRLTNYTVFVFLYLISGVQGRLGNIHPKLLDLSHGEERGIKNEYVVVLDDSTEDIEGALQELLTTTGGKIQYIYKNIFKGAMISAVPSFRLASFLDNVKVKYASPVRNIFLVIIVYCSSHVNLFSNNTHFLLWIRCMKRT